MFLAAGRRITSPHARFLIHPMNWYFSQKSVDHQRLREYLSSLDNDLAHEMKQMVFADDVNHWKVSGG
jgi:ATP-dependent protease ClpP protease subunit